MGALDGVAPAVLGRLSPRAAVRVLGQWRTDVPTYVAIADAFATALQAGVVSPGTLLPGERELARVLRVSRSTTAAAYQRLRDAGVVSSRVGSGTVTLPHPAAGPAAPPPLRLGDDDPVDLSAAVPPAPAGLADAYRAAVERAGPLLASPGLAPRGVAELRELVAARYTARGTPTSADEILVTSGAQHAISLVVRAGVGARDRVVVQSPTYPGALAAARAARARLVGVPTVPDDDAVPRLPPRYLARSGCFLESRHRDAADPDGYGLDLAGLASVVGRADPRLVFLVPDFHAPTGSTLSAGQRVELRERARSWDVPVVVDETLTDVVLDGAVPEPVLGDRPGPLVAVGSLAKTVWPGLRVGWVRAQRRVVDRLVEVRTADDVATPVVEQLVAVELWARQAQDLPGRLSGWRHGRDVLRAALRREVPAWHVARPRGGLSLWVALGEPRAHALASAAARRGVLVAPGPGLTPDGAGDGHVRLTFTADEGSLRSAATRLGAAWAEVTRA
ncbi:DNA-binding transcriptional MocR family regulator [Cellulosimicrobium cellulans]|uniref:aminotransferase-like domain-containing protein n=1 Tax=Cellulosimicrobium cellulans TaxID=1710 RepID=UPI00195A13B6|nr:PLP-dependent aminotransferase family protein [Cellulosimicrobium cellulans]MBM7820297.1 DNA-binding transcriptional MocR family regulator [Cellulosimicrobium cellulans]